MVDIAAAPSIAWDARAEHNYVLANLRLRAEAIAAAGGASPRPGG